MVISVGCTYSRGPAIAMRRTQLIAEKRVATLLVLLFIYFSLRSSHLFLYFRGFLSPCPTLDVHSDQGVTKKQALLPPLHLGAWLDWFLIAGRFFISRFFRG